MACSVVIADAQRLVRDALRVLLESHGGIRVVGETSDGQELVDLCRALKPDVAIVDTQLASLPGLDAMRAIRCGSERPFFVVTSSREAPGLERLSLLAGASAFVPKRATAGELVAAVRASFRGRILYPETPHRATPDGWAAPGGRTEPLTPRQTEVLRLVADGRSTREIAAALGVTIKTVATHRTRLMRRLGAHKASELVRYAIRAGLVEV
jgi:DNA-binding NarL/FixJ family response regulator